MINRFNLLGVVFTCTTASATLPNRLSVDAKCGQQATNLLKTLKSSSDWRELLSLDRNTRRFASPTNKFGTWIYLESDSKMAVKKIAQHSQYAMQSFEFDEACKTISKRSAGKQQFGTVDDLEIVKIAARNREILLVVWTPQMAYMEPGFNELEKLRKSTKIPIKFYLDGLSSKKMAENFLKAKRRDLAYLKPIHSFDFTMRSARTHMPVVFHFVNGRVKDEWRGFRTAGEYRKLLGLKGAAK